MEIEKLLFPRKVALLAFLFLAFNYQSIFAQCTNPTPTGNISQVFCKTDNSTIANLSATGVTIVWYDAPSGGELYGNTEVLVNGVTYYADDISGSSCSTSRLAVTVTIYGDFPTNVDVSVGKCAIDNPTVGNLSATGQNIAWYDAQIGGNLLPLSTLLVNGRTYWVQQTENGCTSNRFPTMVSLIDPLTPTTAPIQSFCYPPNPTVASLRASGSTILWYDSETSTTPLKTTTPLVNGEDYWVAEVTFPCVSSVRAKTTVILDAAPDAGESSSLQECEVSFVTTNLFDLLGGTPDTTGIWTGPSTLSNGYLGTFEPGINTIGTYTYTVSSTLGICPSDSATISVTITIVPPPTTANVIQVFCEIENATIADLSANGNNIVWYDTETSTIELSPSEVIVDGEDYWGALPDPTSGCLSAIRLKITANITVIPPPTTANVNQVFCEIDNPTVEKLSASGSDIHWYATETSTTRLNPSENLINGVTYWASQTAPTSGCESANRLAVNVTIIKPLPPTTTQTNQVFCEIDNPKVASLSAIGTGILWYATETSTTPLSTSDLLVNGNYWASQTETVSGCESATRLVVNVSITTIPPPTTTATNQSFCEIDNPKVANLGATGTGILWYATETSAIPLNSTDLLVNGTSYWASQTASGCESVTRLGVTVSITTVPPPTTTAVNQTFCQSNNPKISDLSASGTGILWYATETSATPLSTATLLVNGTSYWASQTDVASGCKSATRLVVNVSIIIPEPPIIIAQNKTFCEIQKATVADLSPAGNIITWYESENATTPLNATTALINGEDYWSIQTIATSGCENITKTVVTVSIISIPPPTSVASNQSFCEIEKATIADLNVTGSQVLWYDTETSTTPLSTSNLLVNGASYWASQTETVSGCESATRLVVNVSITTITPPTTTATNQSFCEIDNPKVANLGATGTGMLWYATETSAIPLNSTDLLVNGTSYWASQTASGCESVTRLGVTVSITTVPPPTTTAVNQTFCQSNNPKISDLSASGTGILWYATETSATPLSTATLLVNGTSYWASQTDVASGCKSATRLMVNVSIIIPVPPVIIAQNKTFCEIQKATVADLSPAGNIITWYESENATTPLNATTALINGEDYWSIQTIATSGCENITKTVVTVSIISIPPPTTVASNQSFCEIEKATIADLNVTGSQVLWYATETSTTPLNTTTLLANGAYWASQTETVSGCESATRLVVNVSITTVPPPTTATANQSFCMKDYFPNTPTVGNLNVTGNSVRWYATATSLTPLNSTDLLTNGTSYWATQTDATSGCESASRLMVNVALINPATPTTSVVNQAFCLANKPTVSNLLVNESNVLWYNTETSTTPLNTTDVLVNGGNYWAANLNVATGCESISRLRVTVSVTDVAPAVINTVSQTFCQSNSPTIANLAATGNGIVWYATQTGTVALNPTSLLVNGSSYWAAQSNSTTGCVSSVRVVANVTVTTIATPTLISLGNEFCKIDNPTIADLNINVSAVNGGVITWYNAYPNGNLLSASTALVEGETYYAIETSINGCKSINPLAVTVTLEACDQYDVVIYDGFSPTGNGTNDTFKIGNLRELYPDFKVEYYNRWGNLVYTASAANPDWNGRLNGDGELSPAGVYYFIIYFNKNDRKPIQRRLYLSR